MSVYYLRKKEKNRACCWVCKEQAISKKWKNHREFGKNHDTFICNQKPEENIAFIIKSGVDEFEKDQKIRGLLLKELLNDYNNGRSKNYFCIAATVLKPEELREALTAAKKKSAGFNLKEKSRILHSVLDEPAKKRGYYLKLRK